MKIVKDSARAAILECRKAYYAGRAPLQTLVIARMKKKSKSSTFPRKFLGVAYAQWLRETYAIKKGATMKTFENWLQEAHGRWLEEGKGRSFNEWLRDRAQTKSGVDKNTLKNEITAKQDAVKEICNALVSEGFSIEVCEDYVFAKRNRQFGAPIGLFISAQKKESASAYRYVQAQITMVCHVTRFRQRLKGLLRWWLFPRQTPIGELDTNVLTSFGWHAYLKEDVRQESLLAATNELGETRISNVLLWLKNSWPTNPIMPEEYSFHVRQDYNWFRSNLGENAYYFRLKNELLFDLQRECQRLLREKKIKLFEDARAIGRFFLITY